MKLGRLLLLCVACALPLLLPASDLSFATSDPPASSRNPLTGDIETVDMVPSPTGQAPFDIRYTISNGLTKPESMLLTSNPGEDRRPRIDISPAGDTYVCWYREQASNGRVHCRTHRLATDTWSDELLVSEPNEDSRLPVVVHDGTRAWVAFEFAEGTGTTIAVNTVDEPDPIFCRTLVAHTEYNGDVDVQLHHAQGQLWVTWVDSGLEVAWSQYDYTTGEWSLPRQFPYLFSTVQNARDASRALVLLP